jgi:hypothetical protein
VKLPEIKNDGYGFSFETIQEKNCLKKRTQFIGTVCLLAELCTSRNPLLLLDEFDSNLVSADVVEMISWLQKLAGRYQLLAATANEQMATATGWQRVKRLQQYSSLSG